MTSAIPFQFPQINPPQLQQEPGDELGGQLGMLARLLMQRQQIGMERERLVLEQRKAEADIAQGQQATTESKQRTKKMVEESEQKQLELQAQDYATDQFISTLTAPNSLSPENVSAARERIVRQGDRKIASRALLAFDAMIREQEQTQLAAAQARRAKSEAEVAEQTQAAEIATRQLAPKIAQAQLGEAQAATAQRQVDTRLAQLQEVRDPARVARAESLWQTGNVTWKEAREAAGLAAGGIPDDEVFTPLKTSGGTEAQQAAGMHARQMQIAGSLIDQLVDKTGGLTVLGSLQRSGGRISDILLNPLLNAEQQQLVNAHRLYINSYIYLSSGKQINEKEAVRLMGAVAEQANDSPPVKQQKRLLRTIITQSAIDMAGGALDPLTAADQAIATARAQGVRGPQLNFLLETRRKAEIFARELRAGRGPISLRTIPTNPETLGQSMQVIDSLLTTRFRIQPTAPRRRF